VLRAVIDADRSSRRLLCNLLTPRHAVATAATGMSGLQFIIERHPELIFVDLRLPDVSDSEVFESIMRLAPRTPVIVLNANATSNMAIEVIKAGAYDLLLKPLDAKRIRVLVQQALRGNGARHVPVAATGLHSTDGPILMVGRSAPMLEVYKAIGRVAPRNISVLIRGESGTGKELIARSIHEHSSRSKSPFLTVNCAAIPDGLLESELFGHEKGSFTGADRRHIGKFEQCTGGTLFLDEIGDMPPAVQGKLLRVLQAQAFERVGGNETVQTDVRIIAATHRDLSDEATFRADLFYRLNGFAIAVPSLRERPEDIALLLDRFFGMYARHLGKNVEGITDEARRLLLRYSWPGNVRELQNVVRRALLQTTGSVVTAAALPEEVQSEAMWAAIAPDDDKSVKSATATILERLVEQRLRAGTTNLYGEAVEKLDKYLLTRVLRVTGGNQSKAADILGISRRSLRQKRQMLNIQIETMVCDDAHHREMLQAPVK